MHVVHSTNSSQSSMRECFMLETVYCNSGNKSSVKISNQPKFSHTHKHRHKSSTSACASLPVHENGHSYNDAPHLVVLWLLHNGVIGELQLLLQVKAQIL